MIGTRRDLLRSAGWLAGWASLSAQAARAAPLKLSSISVSDFGARPDGTDAGPGFARAIEEVSRTRARALVIPPGTYLFAAQAGIALAFRAFTNLDIQAEGARLLFRGSAQPILFDSCVGIRLNGLTIDWERPPFSQGEVQTVATDNRSVVVALDKTTPMDGWRTVQSISEYDRAARLIARRGIDAQNVVTAVIAIDYRHVQLKFGWPLRLQSTATVVLKHPLTKTHAIESRNCAHLLFEDVTVHAAPGMAFVYTRCKNVSLLRCSVEIEAKSFRLISTNADAAHFVGCTGKIVVQDCHFGSMCDDGVNVNNEYLKIISRYDETTIVVARWMSRPFREADLPTAGDVFEFASGSTLKTLGIVKVVAAQHSRTAPGIYQTLQFAQAVPAEPGDLIVSYTDNLDVVLRGCCIKNNRARGALVHRNARIHDCVFINQSAQGVVLSPNTWWMEGPEVSNVTVTGNTFDGVDRQGLGLGAIYVDALTVGPDGKVHSSSGQPNHDIKISDNRFYNLSGPSIVERNVRF